MTNYELVSKLLDSYTQYRADQEITALSYNMSWATQQNIPMGSEADFVEQCHSRSRMCYNAALQRIKYINDNDSKIDVIGVQECEDANMETAMTSILPHLTCSYRAGVWNPVVKKFVGALLMWDPKVLGTIKNACTINLTNALKDHNDVTQTNDGRPCGIVETTEGIILIVAHFPWFDDTIQKEQLEKFISKNIKRKKRRVRENSIIIMADTNDSKTLISKENPFVIKGKNLSQNMTESEVKTQLKTCCWHEKGHIWKHYDDTGDYVLAETVNEIKIASMENVNQLLNKPTNDPEESNLYSDHKPVIAKVTINLPYD